MSTKWPYVAGIVDGEGSIVIYEVKKQKRVECKLTIPNTSYALMKWLIANFGGRFDTFQPEQLHGYNRKALYRWNPSGKKNREIFLLGILPHLIMKKEQAKVALEFDRLGYGEQEKRLEIAKKCSLLNHGDKSVETNTSNTDTVSVKIEPELIGDDESVPTVM